MLHPCRVDLPSLSGTIQKAMILKPAVQDHPDGIRARLCRWFHLNELVYGLPNVLWHPDRRNRRLSGGRAPTSFL